MGLELSISCIYEDIAVCLYEYTMDEAARTHKIALIKPRCQKALLDAE